MLPADMRKKKNKERSMEEKKNEERLNKKSAYSCPSLA